VKTRAISANQKQLAPVRSKKVWLITMNYIRRVFFN
jgi:hypothetical protein